jgi:hypothetical protein
VTGLDVHNARVGFYRRWSSRAAEQALSSDKTLEIERCAHSAEMWTQIANAIEEGADSHVDHLTRNLLLFEDGVLINAG